LVGKVAAVSLETQDLLQQLSSLRFSDADEQLSDVTKKEPQP